MEVEPTTFWTVASVWPMSIKTSASIYDDSVLPLKKIMRSFANVLYRNFICYCLNATEARVSLGHVVMTNRGHVVFMKCCLYHKHSDMLPLGQALGHVVFLTLWHDKCLDALSLRQALGHVVFMTSSTWICCLYYNTWSCCLCNTLSWQVLGHVNVVFDKRLDKLSLWQVLGHVVFMIKTQQLKTVCSKYADIE